MRMRVKKETVLIAIVLVAAMLIGGFIGERMLGVDTKRYLNLDTGEVEIHHVSRGGFFTGALSSVVLTGFTMEIIVSLYPIKRKKVKR